MELGAFRGPLSQARTPMALEAFPPRLVDAVLAAEDARFLDHAGIDPRGILRAAWVDLVQRRGAQGGSTITQQVIKNRVVGSARTLTRKMKEALLALWVERSVSKERVLEIYLNEVYLGQQGSVSILGMPAAARFYFGKRIGDLDLDEMALLAGLIASPGRYDPRRHPERALLRRNWVLERMAALDLIDEAERRAASARPVAPAAPAEALDPAGDLLDAVAREVARRGWEPVPSRRPAVVETRVEADVQAAARRALGATLAELEAARPALAPLEGAVVVLRPATGAMIALVGGRRGGARGFPSGPFRPPPARFRVQALRGPGGLCRRRVRGLLGSRGSAPDRGPG
ncbi:MAG: transglycosylase domain-containing protein [Acidobacteriota bacterium]|nr:transglycosylase domain-containing protein [Acidobacteriota bacterium]